jgi:hypothetical protein
MTQRGKTVAKIQSGSTSFKRNENIESPKLM